LIPIDDLAQHLARHLDLDLALPLALVSAPSFMPRKDESACPDSSSAGHYSIA